MLMYPEMQNKNKMEEGCQDFLVFLFTLKTHLPFLRIKQFWLTHFKPTQANALTTKIQGHTACGTRSHPLVEKSCSKLIFIDFWWPGG